MQQQYSLQKFIIHNSIIEIFIPDPGLVKYNYTAGQKIFTSPYWAKIWPAAIGLFNFLNNNLHYIKNKKLLELAAGLGLPGIFSASYATEVCISDVEPLAIELVHKSIVHNKLTNASCAVIDWNDFEKIAIPDVLLLSDINYEPAQFEVLLKAIHYFLDHYCIIILSTPQRLSGRDFINSIITFCKEQTIVEVAYEGTTIAVNILVLKN